MSALVAVDIETTGLDPKRHHMWECALIVRGHADDALNGEWLWARSVSLRHADPAALRVGDYYGRAPEEPTLLARPDADPGWCPPSVWSGHVARLTAGATLVGSNPSFDAAFLARFLRWEDYAPAWSHRMIDVRSLALGFMAGRDQGRDVPAATLNGPDLFARVRSDLGNVVGKHTALGDARWALAVHDAVVWS